MEVVENCPSDRARPKAQRSDEDKAKLWPLVHSQQQQQQQLAMQDEVIVAPQQQPRPMRGGHCALPPVNTLTELIDELRRVFADDHVDVDYVRALMRSYKSNPADWKRFAVFDRHKYTRNLVDEGNGKYNLLLLCWNESQGSSVHDHADAHCFMKMLHGELNETQFAWPSDVNDVNEEQDPKDGDSLVEIGTTVIEENDVAYINDSIGLHRVENRSHTETAISLHLYCPPFDNCHMFDQRTGKRTKCTVTFWTKYGNRCSS